MRRMNLILRQTLVAVTVFAFLFVQIAGCGGGSSGDRTDPVVSEPLTLSHSRISPLHFLTIEHPTIEEGQEVLVTFDDGNDFRLSAPATFVNAGTAQLPVPYYFHVDSGELHFAGGTVSVSIDTADVASLLVIDPLPSSSAFRPGEVTALVLDHGIENVQEIMAAVEGHFNPNEQWVAELLYDWQQHLIELKAMRDQFAAGGFSVDVGGRSFAIDAEGIALFDRVHLAWMAGVMEWVSNQEMVTPARISPLSDKSSEYYDYFRNALHTARDAAPYGQAIIAGASMMIAVCTVGSTAPFAGVPILGQIGLVAGVTGGASAGFAALLVGTALPSIVIVATESGLAFIDSVEGKHVDPARRTGRLLQHLASSAVGGTLMTFAPVATAFGWSTGARILATAPSLTFDAITIASAFWDDFWPGVAERERIVPLVIHPWIAPHELEVNQRAEWEVRVTGGVPRREIRLDFGDGTVRWPFVQPGNPYMVFARQSHAYTEAGSYTVSVLATDSRDNRAELTMPVKVKDDEDCIDLSGRWAMVSQLHLTIDRVPQETKPREGSLTITQTECEIQLVGPAGALHGRIVDFDLVEVSGEQQGLCGDFDTTVSGRATEDSFLLRGQHTESCQGSIVEWNYNYYFDRIPG